MSKFQGISLPTWHFLLMRLEHFYVWNYPLPPQALTTVVVRAGGQEWLKDTFTKVLKPCLESSPKEGHQVSPGQSRIRGEKLGWDWKAGSHPQRSPDSPRDRMSRRGEKGWAGALSWHLWLPAGWKARQFPAGGLSFFQTPCLYMPPEGILALSLVGAWLWGMAKAGSETCTGTKSLPCYRVCTFQNASIASFPSQWSCETGGESIFFCASQKGKLRAQGLCRNPRRWERSGWSSSELPPALGQPCRLQLVPHTARQAIMASPWARPTRPAPSCGLSISPWQQPLPVASLLPCISPSTSRSSHIPSSPGRCQAVGESEMHPQTPPMTTPGSSPPVSTLTLKLEWPG